jgi:FemAB-related protein (PEP-CTERM system-associated)
MTAVRTVTWSLSSTSSYDRRRWDQFVTDHVGGTLYHLSTWSELLQRCYGFRPVCLAMLDDADDILGILPLAFVESLLTGRRLISLPCTNAAGPLCRPGLDPRALLEAAVDLANDARCRYLEIRDQPCHEGIEASRLARHDYYGTFLLDLERNTQHRMPTIDKRARRGIARAARDGVKTRFLDDESAPDVFYRLNLLTRHKHGVPPQPRHFFANLWSAFRPDGHVEILVAELEGRPIASIVLLTFKETVTYAYGASDVRFLKHAPNHALFDAALGWATAQGYRFFDFGRTAPDNEGLVEFKRQWGAQFLPLPYFYYPNRDGFVSEAEASWKHRLFTSVWRKLPVNATAVLGPPLYRHLA